MLTPLTLLVGLLTGLFAGVLPVLGAWLLWRAAHPPVRFVREVRRDTADGRTVADLGETRTMLWRERWKTPAVLLPLVLGALLLALPFTGRALLKYAFPAGADEPGPLHGTPQELRRADGTKIHVEVFGSPSAPTLVLTHGWGSTDEEWYYAKKQLAGHYRLIVWDLPGLGETEQPADRDYTLAKMAADLHLVLTAAAGRPVILVGHSIGGMINLTFCDLYPQLLGSQVAGVVEVDTSYTNPVKTAKNSQLNLLLQKPVGEPMLHAMIALSPLVHVMNSMSYHEGLLYLVNASGAFAGTETRGQLDMTSRFQVQANPGLVARGTLGMFHWDETPELARLRVPVLMIVGEQDTTTLPSASATMHAAIARSGMQTVSPANHYALLERNRDVNDAIDRFAREHLR